MTILGILCIFPYFSPVRLGIDTSPLYLLPAVGLCIIGVGSRFVTHGRGLWLAALAWFSLAILTAAKAVTMGDLGAMRFAAGLGAQGLLIVALGSVPFDDWRHSDRAMKSLAKATYWGSLAWLAAAVIQFISALVGSSAGPKLLSLVVSASRTTEGRGFTSLAAEPSFAGITCCLLAAFAWVLRSNGLIAPRRGMIATISFILVALLTISFTSYLSLAILGLFIARRSTLAVVALLTIAMSIFFLPIDALQELRIVQLVKTLTSSPDLLLIDASVAQRAADMLGRLLSLATPGGMLGHFFERDPLPVLQQSLGLIGGSTRDHLLAAADTMLRGAHPMSSLGALVFEFGILGLGLYFATVALIWRRMYLTGLRGCGVLFAIATFGFMTQLPLSYPTAFALPLALGLAGRSKNREQTAAGASDENQVGEVRSRNQDSPRP